MLRSRGRKSLAICGFAGAISDGDRDLYLIPAKSAFYSRNKSTTKGVMKLWQFSEWSATQGYTVMSNHHLRNKELTLKAKGLLSQMLSLARRLGLHPCGAVTRSTGKSIDAIRDSRMGAGTRRVYRHVQQGTRRERDA